MPVPPLISGPVPKSSKPLLRVLGGERQTPPPVWLMRQAGRYLPEYRALREQADGFLDLCLTPDTAVEVTLQPVRRFGLDGAILFSDILVVPYALGRRLWFEEGVGPRLDPLSGSGDLDGLGLDGLHEALAPVYEALRRLSGDLPPGVALIGFAGAPWTVASYMIEGGSSRDFLAAKVWAYTDPDGFSRLIDVLAEATAEYLKAQVEAGAEVLQLFDSWAGVWPASALRRWCLEPAGRIVRAVKAAYPDIPIIVFPRGAGVLYEAYAAEVGADALALDTTVPVSWARDHLQRRVPVQGNLDPIYVVSGGEPMRAAAEEVLAALSAGPYVFNLGHGVVPQTPPEHVAELVRFVRDRGSGGQLR